MANPIEYSELINENVKEGFDGWIKQMSELKESAMNTIASIKTEAASLGETLKNVSVGGGKDSAKEIETTSQKIESLRAAYANLGFQVDEYDRALKAVSENEKNRKRVIEISSALEKDRADTYEAQAQQYKALKILLSQLTEEELKNSEIAQRMLKTTADLHDKMNAFQQSTGNYTLQVGQYTKAFNGLNIATQQVIRELPVLANGWSMFFIAISNNLPILGDAIRSFQESAKAGKEAMNVTKALAKSVFSWQTALIAVITLLPILIRNIEKKRKAQKGLNDETEKTLTLDEALRKAYKREEEAAIKSASSLKTLYEIMRNAMASPKDRLAAMKALSEATGIEIKTYNKENKAIEEYISNLEQEAIAKEALGIISDARVKVFQLEQRKQDILRSEDYQKAKKHNAEMKALWLSYYNDDIISKVEYDKKVKSADEKLLAYTKDIDKQILDQYSIIERESEKIKATGISALYLNKNGKDSIENSLEESSKDYEKQFVITTAQLIEDAKAREIALLEIERDYEIKALEEARDAGDLSVEQQTYINGIIENLKRIHLQKLAEIDEKYDLRRIKEIEISAKKELAISNNNSTAQYKNSLNRRKAILTNQKIYLEKLRDTLSKEGLLTEEKAEEIASKLKAVETEISESAPKSIFEWFTSLLDINSSREQYNELISMFSSAIGYAQDWIGNLKEMADVAAESYKSEAESAKKALDYELQARANGYANNVELARREYEEKLRLEEEAVKESQRLQKIQEGIDTAEQATSLATTIANYFKTYSKSPLGVALGIAASAAMITAFVAAKVSASKASKQKTYGEGMSEYLDYGGSHSSGNDIDFGVMKDGTRRKVERGEIVAVVNKRNVRKYGVDGVTNIIDALNHGTFENKYGLAFSAISGGAGSSTNLDNVERGIDTLVEQGKRRVVVSASGTIEYYKNSKRIIKN